MPNTQEDVVGGGVVSTGISVAKPSVGSGAVAGGVALTSSRGFDDNVDVARRILTSQEDDSSTKITVTGQQPRFKLSEFRSEINRNGIIIPNRFVAIFSLPKALTDITRNYSNPSTAPEGTYTDNDNFITLRCDNVIIPGVNFFTTRDIKRYGIGQFERRPYLPSFNPIRLQFIVDRNAKIVRFFNDWTNNIINYNTDMGMNPAKQRGKPYLLRYKVDFISPTLRIWVYDENNLTAFAVKIYDAYPLNTSDTEINWGTQNTPMTFNVTLQYTHMSMQFLNRNGEEFDLDSKKELGSEPKSTENILSDSELEYKTPDFWQTIYSRAEEVVTGEISSAAESYFQKTIDNIFR